MEQREPSPPETYPGKSGASRLLGWLLLSSLVYSWLLVTGLYSCSKAASLPIPPKVLEQPVFQLDINVATAAQLQALPDIGPRLAERVIVDRTRNGRFCSVDELQRVRGFGPKTLEKLRPMLIVSD